MNDINSRYSSEINKLFTVLYGVLEGKKHYHADVKDTAKELYAVVLRNLVGSPDHNEILNAVIARYETEVGIQTFDPDFVDAQRESQYWLHKIKDSIPHPFFDRYRQYLFNDGFDRKTIDNIETTCEQVLARCANPKTTARTDKKRGLVVGDVQSGKTANYLGLINMAYDYGYRIVVLLAGTTNSLRTQTQKRTDKGVIGAKSDTIGNTIEFLGVGLNTGEHFVVPFTNQVNDFKAFMQKNINVAIGDINKPVVLVVKKVKSVLDSVAERLQGVLNETGLDSKSILIIDDEADNASINTAKDPSKQTAINKGIRNIFNKFPIASYVGYTATPFANVFINPYDSDEDFMDLFPADFIAQLYAPSTYFGGREVFPTEGEPQPKCIRLISEDEPDFLPVIHKKDDYYYGLADSLKEAIHCFIINCAIRTIRGHKTKHRSMMINITRYNDMQQSILEKVTEYVEKVTNAIEQLSDMPLEAFCKNQYCNALYQLYQTNPFYEQIRTGDAENEIEPICWDDIQLHLYDEAKAIIPVTINSRNGKMSKKGEDGSNKRFDYDDYENEGARVIAIGGMVLSRGLTLEGLMVSYYSRNAGTYDTLLQMCRWFGYRPGYRDLCRVYVSQENIDCFDAVLTAVEDLKSQFQEMKIRDKKPIDFGVMIRECPDTLETTMLITSRNKMRGTETLTYSLNYSGVYADTSKLLRKTKENDANIDAFKQLLSLVKFSWYSKNGTPVCAESSDRQYYMASSVSQHFVAEFIKKLNIPYVNKKFDTESLAEYVSESTTFSMWDVVVANGSSNSEWELCGVKLSKRSFNTINEEDPYIRIGGSNNRVLDPGLLNAGLWHESDRALSAKEYLKLRGEAQKNPMLIVFPIELKYELSEKEKQDLGSTAEKTEERRKNIAAKFNGTPLLAFAIAFPGHDDGIKVVYRANAVKLAQITNGLEYDDEDEGEDGEDED